jgi:hypothetical protein
MDILFTSKWTYTDGPAITLNCPQCQTQNAPAQTRGTLEKNSLFWVIPLFSTTYTTVTCGHCGKTFRLLKPLDEVTSLPPDAIAQYLEQSVPFLIKFCIVAGIVLFPVPVVGLVLAAIGLAATIKKTSGWKKAAVVGLILSSLPILALIIAAIFG